MRQWSETSMHPARPGPCAAAGSGGWRRPHGSVAFELIRLKTLLLTTWSPHANCARVRKYKEGHDRSVAPGMGVSLRATGT